VSFRRNRNVIALALANFKEQCQQVERRTWSTEQPYKAAHISIVPRKRERESGARRGKIRWQEVEGAKLTESQFDFTTGI
jgi:hypothetical protein